VTCRRKFVETRVAIAEFDCLSGMLVVSTVTGGENAYGSRKKFWHCWAFEGWQGVSS